MPATTSRIDLAPAQMDAETHDLEMRTVRHAALASRGSPFFDATIGGVFIEQRFSDPLVVGLQGGLFAGDIVRIAVRVEMPSSEANDQARSYYDSNSVYSTDSSPAKLLYGAAVGIVAVDSENFVFSPGLMFMRSDVSDYGSVLGASLPFEWVTQRGLRFGLEVDIGRAFGGKVHYGCGNVSCPAAQLESKDRDAGRALGLRFSIGYGFGYAQRR